MFDDFRFSTFNEQISDYLDLIFLSVNPESLAKYVLSV